ncbi:hypothetical protein FLONG3_1309 [Fusarium longipes]|uniref:Uncharacterized protein n=1 Tax=Fusarium longipes TaxID=694270 RepID=A0A395T782_9HYPO|nr:hypothetical protein FLONG3_1309 [Fusarium longipes]
MNTQYRHLTLRHEQRLINDEPPLKLDEAQFPFYVPSLPASFQEVTVTQSIPLVENVPVKRHFDVPVPRYSTSPDDVATVFPTPGHGANSITLPHIVFKDPHFPWERKVSKNDRDIKNTVPWIALVTFAAEELQLNEKEMNVFPESFKHRINANLGWDLPVNKIKDLTGDNLTNVIPEPTASESRQTATVIPVRGHLFRSLFMGRDGKTDISKFRFMSHVRTVATEGDSGTFGVTVSHRFGPQDIAGPRSVITHLVSLENVDGIEDSKIGDIVLMNSLYSWTYTALPEGSDVATTSTNLGDTNSGSLSVLRTTRKPDLTDGTDQELSTPDIFKKRLNDGYTLTRYRTVTDEETAAMFRGPLVPTKVAHPLRPDIPIQSNFGTDLKVFDSQLKLMDISYSNAWQLGRTMAMSDSAFTTALARLRSVIHKMAIDESKKQVHKSGSAYQSRDDVISRMEDTIQSLYGFNSRLESTTTTSKNRWKSGQVPNVDTSPTSSQIFSQIYDHALAAGEYVSKSANEEAPYCYHNVPNNTDYAIVQEWILDRMHLAGIPAHYLVVDPSHLPKETLRFFYIDENWTESLVDGALSLANHFANTPEEDYCRTVIKEQLNKYLKSPIPGTGYHQQMPSYGFLLRSQLLVRFPDLSVTAKYAEANASNDSDKVKPKAPMLVQRRLADDVMLCLFDRTPPDLVSLEFTPPAHQLSYRVAVSINEQDMVVSHTKNYACKNPPIRVDERRKPFPPETYKTAAYVDWNSRTLKVEEYSEKVFDFLKAKMPEYFEETAPTSATFALQLNEPIFTLHIETLESKDREALDVEPDVPFQFHPPAFPKHKYMETEALVAPPQMNSISPQEYHGQIEPLVPFDAASVHQPNRVIIEDLKLKPKANRPNFIVGIYPVEQSGYVPTNREVDPDLIVSIVQEEPGFFSQRLKKIEIRIPRGDIDDPKNPPEDSLEETRALVRRDYEALLPSMLSNLRFNVQRSFENDELVLKVVPRSKNGVELKDLIEASFVLPMVRVIPWTREYVSRIKVEHLYEDGSLRNDVDILMRKDPPSKS